MKESLTEVVSSDLRCLLFWASVGVHLSRGGYRQEEIPSILERYASELLFELPYSATFAAQEGMSHVE